ncbi:Bromodomain-domain-containing protein [Nadsonia fulvescens var. elongata DSM 6958]|uniref:Bromodomain-domain-containing protein n=1 Tax=Nadsonia fulvescens var. elongata DSM 6958 TaxID=857566 RepID=A0A1E3PIA6_9ASCO|nr:Bromodomain-domain-containing protein [Nadsonia fulvescens var. elongata DSM 6958]
MGSSKRRSSGVSQDLKKRIKIKAEPSSPVDFTDFYKKVLKTVSDMNDGVHSMSFQFLKLPQKKLYPDYYKVITKPISLHEVKEKVNKKQYTDPKQFEADFQLMHTNAVTYNEQGSQIANDAELIFKFVQDQVKNRLEQDLAIKNNEIIEFQSYRDEFEQGLSNILDDLIKYKVKQGRRPSEIFMDEPSAEDYPEYYEVIKRPMAFNTIKSKLSQHQYHQLQEFISDTELIYKNAKLFNQEGSQVYVDANILEKQFKAKVEKFAASLADKEIPEGYQEWAITEQPDSGSPLGSVKGDVKPSIKLKLTPKLSSPAVPAQKLKINLGKLGRAPKKTESDEVATKEDQEDEGELAKEIPAQGHGEGNGEEASLALENEASLATHEGDSDGESVKSDEKILARESSEVPRGPGSNANNSKGSIEPGETSQALSEKHDDETSPALEFRVEEQAEGDSNALKTAEDENAGDDHKDTQTRDEGEVGSGDEVKEAEVEAVEESVFVFDDRLRPESIPIDQALVSEVCLSSVLPSGRHQFQKNFLSGTVAQQDPFQIRISASKTHVYQSFTFTLPSHHTTLAMNMLLHHSLASRAYQLAVTLNGNVVNPLSIHTGSLWGDDNDGVMNKPINGRFELRLSPGLNHIECQTYAVPMVVAQPNGSEKPMRQSTLQHYLQTGDIEKQLDSERFVFWVNLSPGI